MELQTKRYMSWSLGVVGEIATYSIATWLIYQIALIGAFLNSVPDMVPWLVLMGAALLIPVYIITRYVRLGRGTAQDLRVEIKNKTGDWIDPIKVLIATGLWAFTTLQPNILKFVPQSDPVGTIVISDYFAPGTEDNLLAAGFYEDLLDFLPTIAPDIQVLSQLPLERTQKRIAILEASGEEDEEGFSVNLALRDLRSDHVFWKSVYTSSKRPGDILRLRSRIAREIADLLDTDIDRLYAGNSASMGTADIDPAAYQEFLAALALSRHNIALEVEQSRQIIEHLENAVAIDPNFHAAWARLANAYVSSRWFGYLLKDEDKSNHILERLETLLGANHFVTLRTKGIIKYQKDHDLVGGREALLAANRLNPNEVTTNAYLGFIERRMGLVASSIKRHEFVMSIDPLFEPAATILPHSYDSLGRWDELEAFLANQFRGSIHAQRDADLILGQIMDENLPNSDQFKRIANHYDAYDERTITYSYWFTHAPTQEHMTFVNRLLDVALRQLEEMRDRGEDVSYGQQKTNRILLARAAMYKQMGKTDLFEADLNLMLELGIETPADYTTRSAPRKHAQTVIFHALRGDIQAQRRELEKVEHWIDHMPDRLAALQVYSDLACAAVLAKDTDMLLRLIEKSQNSPREFPIIATAMKVPGFQAMRSDPRLQAPIAEMTSHTAMLEKIVGPYLAQFNVAKDRTARADLMTD